LKGNDVKRLLFVVFLSCELITVARGQTPESGTSTNKPAWCSYYSSKYNGRRTASGERFSNQRLTAASRTYPMGKKLRLTSASNGKTVVVVVNDRGPFVAGREISVTRRAAQQLGFVRAGLAQVTISEVSE
jgi:rare lipoprotein A